MEYFIIILKVGYLVFLLLIYIALLSLAKEKKEDYATLIGGILIFHVFLFYQIFGFNAYSISYLTIIPILITLYSLVGAIKTKAKRNSIYFKAVILFLFTVISSCTFYIVYHWNDKRDERIANLRIQNDSIQIVVDSLNLKIERLKDDFYKRQNIPPPLIQNASKIPNLIGLKKSEIMNLKDFEVLPKFTNNGKSGKLKIRSDSTTISLELDKKQICYYFELILYVNDTKDLDEYLKSSGYERIIDIDHLHRNFNLGDKEYNFITFINKEQTAKLELILFKKRVIIRVTKI